MLATASLARNHSETAEQLSSKEGDEISEPTLSCLERKNSEQEREQKAERKGSFSTPSSVSRAGKNHPETGSKRLCVSPNVSLPLVREALRPLGHTLVIKRMTRYVSCLQAAM